MTNFIKEQSFAKLYESAMKLVYDNYDFMTRPRGMNIKECLNVVLELEDPYNNLFKYEDKSITMPTGYLKKEMALYLKATSDATLFAKASPFWNTIKNANGTINSAYGNLIFNPSLKDGRSQFDWAFDSLKADKDSRLAFMRYNNTNHQFNGNKDVPCTFILTFHIRNNKLYSTVEMRSNDIVKGTTYDIPAFVLFQHLMLLRLRTIYPELQIGSYTHIASSFHLYESDFELVEKRLKSNIIENRYPMPNNWNCIKSIEIDRIVDEKINKQGWLFDVSETPENVDFYNWLLS